MNLNIEEREEILDFFEKENNVDLPYAIKISSPKAGKNILISGAVHGNEPVGTRFAYNFIKDFKAGKINLESGSITFVLGNPKAFEKNQRYIDSDLNRIFDFPEEKKNSYEWHRAKEMDNFLKENNFDFGIDLHSVSVGNVQIYICDKDNQKLKQLLEETSAIKTIFYFDKKSIPGTFMNRFEKYQSNGIGLECGNHSSEIAISVAEKQVDILLKKFGLIKGDYKDNVYKGDLDIYETITHIRTGDNFKWLLEEHKTGLKVNKGEKICTDDKNGIQVAEQDSYLFMPTAEEKVKETDYDAGYLCIKK